MSGWCLNDVWLMSESCLDVVSMMSEPCLNDVWKMFAHCLHNFSRPFWCSCCFLLFKFMAGAWVLYLDVVHHSVYFHWFCFLFFVISGIFARKVCFFSIFIFSIVSPCLFRHSHGWRTMIFHLWVFIGWPLGTWWSVVFWGLATASQCIRNGFAGTP